MNDSSIPAAAVLVPIYKRLFADDGNDNEYPEYEKKSYFLSDDAISQHGRKLIETIAGIANSGRLTGAIMCRGEIAKGDRPPPISDPERLDQLMRSSVGPPIHFSYDRTEIDGRIVDVIFVPRSLQRPHFMRDTSGSNRFFIPIRGAANNATAARHHVDEMYRESTIDIIRKALGVQFSTDNRDEVLSYAAEVGYGIER